MSVTASRRYYKIDSGEYYSVPNMAGAVCVKPDVFGYWQGPTWQHWLLAQPLSQPIVDYALERLCDEAFGEVEVVLRLTGARLYRR